MNRFERICERNVHASPRSAVGSQAEIDRRWLIARCNEMYAVLQDFGNVMPSAWKSARQRALINMMEPQ